jgi:hypothetical protein
MKMLKNLLILLIAVFATASTALAHDMKMAGSKEGFLGIKPEYLHVLLNPLPVYGLGIGIATLAVGLLARNKSTRTAGLIITAVCAASAWPVLYFGQHGYNNLAPMLDTESHQWLDEHMNRAERFIYFFYATAVLAIAALAFSKKFPKAAKVVTLLTLFAAMASLGIGGWISRAGGEVSHSEFRGEEAPPTSPSHEHGGHDHMETSHTNGAHQHQQGAPQKPPEETELPNTIEGVWTAIHKHHSELASAVNDKKFSDVQSHAKELSTLAKKLVEVVRPDQKSATESGVSKINPALDALQSSAETGSELVMKNNFKEFEEALKQFGEQMKKQ